MSLNTSQQQLWLPIVKSEKTSDGRLRVFGLASDHSTDEDGEIIKASANAACLDYTNKFGKFDWDHNSMSGGDFIGDVVKARIISNADARRKYPDQVVVGDPLEVEGFVYAKGSDPTPDLRKCHHYAEIGARLGFSIFGDSLPGTRMETLPDGRTSSVRVPRSIPTIAITPQPKNTNSACYFAKSFRAVLADKHVQSKRPSFSQLVKAMSNASRDEQSGVFCDDCQWPSPLPVNSKNYRCAQCGSTESVVRLSDRYIKKGLCAASNKERNDVGLDDDTYIKLVTEQLSPETLSQEVFALIATKLGLTF